METFKIDKLKFKLENWKFFVTNYLFFLGSLVILFGTRSIAISKFKITIPLAVGFMVLIIPLLFGYVKIWNLRNVISKKYDGLLKT